MRMDKNYALCTLHKVGVDKNYALCTKNKVRCFFNKILFLSCLPNLEETRRTQHWRVFLNRIWAILE